MSETTSHKRAKSKAAGKNGQTEVKISRNRRLDAVTKSGKRITEVERSGSTQGLNKAANRLKSRRSSQKVLQVPQKDIPKAVKAMKKMGVKGTVKNMSGTKRRSVK